MAKSRKNRKSIIKSIKTTGETVLPVVDKGLKNVGTTAKYAAVKSAPVLAKGVSAVYGTMATGFNLGAKGVKRVSTLAKGTKKMYKKRHSRRHRHKTHKR